MIEFDGKKFLNEQEAYLYCMEQINQIRQILGNAAPEPIAGPTGPQGATGPRGKGFYGVTAELPSATAYEEGDFYLLFNGNVYKKVGGSWLLQYNLKGPQGPVGLTGGTEVVANPVDAYTDNLEKIKIDGTTYNILPSEQRAYLDALFNSNSPLVEINGTAISIPNNFSVDGDFSLAGDMSVQGDTFFDNNIKINDTSLDCILDANDNPLIICERLKDTNGDLRFVEGTITMENISGVTFSYHKWSLSGSHLMIVIAGTVASGVTLSAEKWCDLDLPDYIKNKISPVFEAVIERQQISAWNSDYTSIYLNFWLLKYGGLQINQYETPTTTKSYNFRIQFDLLIDMA